MTRNFPLLLWMPRRTPRSLPIERASSMHRHTSVLVQSIMHMAMESTSCAYMRVILNVICHQSFVYMHVDTHAILKTC